MSDAADAPLPPETDEAHDAFRDTTVTFLFTDIEGSTDLWQHAPREMRSALERHDTILQQTITHFGGDVFKRMGDAFYAVFPNSASALEAAISAQRALLAEDTPDHLTLRVRIAINAGMAQKRDGDYFGGALSRTSRLRDALHGGQIALTQATVSLLRDSTATDATSTYELRDLGEHTLRDLNDAERVFQIIAPDLPSTFPPLRTPAVVPHNLPRQFTSFIGREWEIGQLTHLLASSSLVTITGPGGSGKTRLAVQTAADQLSLFRDGVWFIDLGPVTEAVQVGQSIAAVLQVREESGRSVRETVAAHLQAKNTLLVLDNCEHLIDECARLTENLLRACPGIKILATSREGLDVPGEHAFALSPLPQPGGTKAESVARIARYEAVRLFTERAATVAQNFTLTRENAGSVARICRHLDGIPLALELAAAWSNVLTPQQIEARLDDRFRFLSKSSRTALPRQQTLRAAMDWSFDLLSETERILLSRLSVFSGSFSLAAAESICADDALTPDEVLDLLYQLVRKSLVVRNDEKGEARFRLLESIRQYNTARLQERNETQHLLERHLAYYLALAEEAEPHLQAADQQTYLNKLATEYDNLRAALAADTDAARRLLLATSLHRFWLIRGYSRDGQQILEQLLQITSAVPESVSLQLAMRAENAVGILAMTNGDWDCAKDHLERSAEYSRAQNNLLGEAKALTNLGIVASQQKNYEEAKTKYLKSAEIYRTLHDDARLATCLSNLGAMADDENDYVGAKKYLSESLLIDRRTGDRLRLANTLHNLGVAAIGLGQYATALQYLNESLLYLDEIGMKNNISNSAMMFAVIAFNEKHLIEAIELFSFSFHFNKKFQHQFSTPTNLVMENYLAKLRAMTPETIFDLHWNKQYNFTTGEISEIVSKFH